MKSLSLVLLVGALLATAASAAACASSRHRHEQGAVRPADGQSLQCQLCYDEAVNVRKSHRWPKAVAGGKPYVTITRHQCPDCRTQVEVYAADGTPMIRCARCAPDGLPCTRCLPPKTSS